MNPQLRYYLQSLSNKNVHQYIVDFNLTMLTYCSSVYESLYAADPYAYLKQTGSMSNEPLLFQGSRFRLRPSPRICLVLSLVWPLFFPLFLIFFIIILIFFLVFFLFLYFNFIYFKKSTWLSQRPGGGRGSATGRPYVFSEESQLRLSDANEPITLVEISAEVLHYVKFI